jgi:nitrite reductase/ring-hydroxylating ferredoxin subunit
VKKTLFLFAFLLAFMAVLSCSDDGDDGNQFLPNVPVNQTIFLNNPEFIDLQVVGGWAYAQGGISGIVIYHSGINSYLAFERSAPHLTPRACSRMNVENSLVMVCPCDDAEFNLLNGAPLTEGIRYAARQYRVLITGPNTLQITNF